MVVRNFTGSENAEPAGAYEQHFGLRESPFTLTANPRFTFGSRAYAGVVDTIIRALQRHEPLLVITGPPGSGKTLVCRTVEQWRSSRTFVALLTTPPASASDLLRLVLDEFGVLPRDSRRSAEATHFELVRVLEQFLASLGSLSARAVILVDDAHRLSTEVFEGLRSLINFETETEKLLQLVLLGEPKLAAMLSDPELTQLNQRVTRRYVLGPLLPDEVAGYIEHRLSVAHGERVAVSSLFSDDAITTIRTLSSGVPRVINLLCDRALEGAHVTGVSPVSPAEVLEAAGSLNLTIPPTAYFRRHRIKLAAAAVILLVASPLGYWMYARGRAVESPRQSQSPAAPPVAASPAEPPPVVQPAPISPAPATVLVPKLQARASVPPPQTGSLGFMVLASSFRTDARAHELSARISALGLPVRVRSASGWYQVVVGPYGTRAEAERARGQLNRVDIAEAVIQSASPAVSLPERASAPESGLPPAPAAAARPPAPVSTTPPAPVPSAPPTADGRTNLMNRARTLAQAADVRALIQLRQTAESQLLREGRPAAEVEKTLEEIDVLLEGARRRRLELDAKSFGTPR